ncbi:uncharacterized protein LOC124271950 [Haliotis rubra]|uniref:uncharacterized protein LOC124271950 n=1 Tax=Haliotis rubra TaxID=36100 RepID=UPI001EE598CF|nr:uncharacterized protein LOC124271950 [Haliotis rubra]
MSVWTDWLDFIPVVGTVKNTVEAVTAVCHGDYDLAKEKGASAALGLVLDVFTGGTEHAAGTAALRLGEKLAVKGTTEKVVVNAMAKVAGRAGAKGVADRVLIHEFVKKSNRPKDPKTNEGEKKTSQRGEHVINNNVLKVFRTMIDRFAAKIGSTAAQLLEKKEHTAAHQAYYAPLPEATTQSIRYHMVAHIPEEDPYIDANATVYGIASGAISDMVVTYMYDYYGNNSYNAPVVDRSITELVHLLNESHLYVDEYAKQYWLHHGGSEATFEESRRQVVQMFRRLCTPTSGENEAKQWVRDLTGHI